MPLGGVRKWFINALVYSLVTLVAHVAIINDLLVLLSYCDRLVEKSNENLNVKKYILYTIYIFITGILARLYTQPEIYLSHL